MAILLRVSVFGAMPNGEEWSVNPVFRIGTGGAPLTPAQCLTIATACAAVTVPTGLTALMQGNTTVTGVRVENRDLTNGSLASQGEALKGTPTPGTGSNIHGYQASAVISLRTGTPGASGRGRLYWPATGAALNSTDYRISSSNVSNAVTDAKTYLSGLSSAIAVTTTTARLVVWSRKGASTADVTSLLIGNVLDSQRRRRDVLVESYTSTVFP